MVDVAIIGAGVIGCSIARELAKYDLKVCVLERKGDVATGTSKANSGIVHAGEDPTPGTMKAKMNVLGNPMFDKLKEELDFPFKRTGSMVLCFDEEDMPKLEELRRRGLENGIEDTMVILNRQQALELEPNLSNQVVGALLLPTGGIVCPYEFTIALAENAYENGVEFLLDTEVRYIDKKENKFTITTSKGMIESKFVVNAAGVNADIINNMLSNTKYTIIPRKGEYLLFDKNAASIATRTLFQLPTKMGKGILVTPTVSGNLLMGPTAEDIEDRQNKDTTRDKLGEVSEKARRSVQRVPMGQVITSFAGIRAHEEKGDFVLGESEDVEGLINALGIESPGLTSAPAIASYIAEIIREKTSATVNKNFNPIRKGIVKFSEATLEERKELIKNNKHYGKIVCRCETVTEAEIIDAITRPLGAKTVDGVKHRTRAGMGRCQSGFCMNRVMELLAEYQNISLEDVTKSGEGTNLLVGELKDELKKEYACESKLDLVEEA